MNPLPTKPNRWRPITVFNLLVGMLFSLSVLGQTTANPGFYLIKGSFNWNEANADAAQRGGHLATIASQSEQNAVAALVNGQPGDHFFLGATDSLIEGEWKWVTGEPFTYTYWSSSAPNNLDNEDYLFILNRSGNVWEDGKSDTRTSGGYVLEIEQQPYQPAFLKDGLVAYYPFNGDANDESGNGNNGSVIGVQWVDSYDSFSGKCAFFNGDSFVSVQNASGINFSAGDKLSFSLWIKSQKGSGHVFGKRAGVSPCNYQADFYDSMIMFRGDPFSGDNSVSNIELNRWVQIVCTWDGNACKIYLDGELRNTTKISPIGLATTAPLLIGGSSEFEKYQGSIDNFRIYRKALSDTEVKALYKYETTPQPLNPRIATATAQVLNGFVVGATITDGGYGYVENPAITIIGGGGVGAKAISTQFNGVVTSITITNPGSGYTSTPTITIAPPPFPPKKATATSQVVNGFVVGTKITDAGFGYDAPPSVLLVGGGGTGAIAVATVQNGVVTAITITNPGTGYTSAPLIRIASPPFTPKLAIEVSKVNVRLSVVLGRKYQIESSSDLANWKPASAVFIAQDEELLQEFDVNTTGNYYRINQVP
jgi:hypothetical protein